MTGAQRKFPTYPWAFWFILALFVWYLRFDKYWLGSMAWHT